jgi:glucokinase
MFEFPVLLGDIGGTNARFAILDAPGGAMRSLPRLLTASMRDPVGALGGLLSRDFGPPPRSAILAVANRVDSLQVRLTNAAWTIDAAALGPALGLSRVVLVNDYPPVAAALAVLDAARGDLARIGPDLAPGSGPRLVLGPGTGLGAAALVPVAERFAILPTEAGHVEFGPVQDDEAALWPSIERVNGRITAEAVLSGPGLFRLCSAVAKLRGRVNPFAVPNDVIVAALAGDEALAVETLSLFARLLGRFAGDLALAFEASGGVFIAGGIAPRIVGVFRSGAFRAAFEAKAPHDAWARRVPTFVITHQEPALQGLGALVSDPARFVLSLQEWTASAA